MVEMTLAKPTPKARRRRKKDIVEDEDEDVRGEEDETPPTKKRKTTTAGGSSSTSTVKGKGNGNGLKGKQKAILTEEEIDRQLELDDDEDGEDHLDHMYVNNPLPPRQNQRPAVTPSRKKINGRGRRQVDDDSSGEYETIEADIIEHTSDEDSDAVVYGWSTSMREEPVARRKKPMTRVMTTPEKGSGRGKVKARVPIDEDDIVVLSSD